MSHLLLFCFEISFVDLVWFDDDGNGVLYLDAMCGQSDSFGGIVSDETDVGGLEIAQNLRADAVVALIGFESEFKIGFYRIAAQFLQMVGTELVH